MTKGFLRLLCNGEWWNMPVGGEVIGEFVCAGIDDIECSSDDHKYFSENGSCLSVDEFIEYCKGKDMYGWHISDLVIYDKPKELSEFFKIGHSNYCELQWEERERLKTRLAKHNEITGDKAHLNTDADFKNILKMLSPFKMVRPPQSWCYVEEALKGGAEDE